jgi:hypothetical protein
MPERGKGTLRHIQIKQFCILAYKFLFFNSPTAKSAARAVKAM